MAQAKLTARTFATSITPEPDSWPFRGGWAPNQAAKPTISVSVNFKNCSFYRGRAPLLAYPASLPPSKPEQPRIAPPERRRSTLICVGIGIPDRLVIGHALGIHGDGFDLLLDGGFIAEIRGDGGDGIDGVHPLQHLAEGGVLSVEEVAVGVHDEELAAGGVRGLCPRHGQNAAGMAELVFHAVELKLALDAVAGAAGSRAVGAAALDHKAGNDAVEDETVVKLLLDQGNKVIDGLRRDLGIKLTDDPAAVFHFDGHNWIFHYREFLSFITR